MFIKKSAPGDSDTVNLTGDLTIARAAEILSLLKNSLQESDEVRITLQNVSRVDLSCLQLFCSAHRTAAATGKSLILDSPLPDVFKRVIRQTGFKRRKGCAFSPDTNCLCFDGGNNA